MNEQTIQIPEHILKKKEYEEFIEWTALPRPLRVLKEQKEFALSVGVDPATLSQWKKEEGFWDEVRKLRKYWIKDKVSDVVMGLYEKAKEQGSAPEVKLFLEFAGEFKEETIQTIRQELSEEDKELLKQAIEYGRIKDKKEDDRE